MYCTYCGFKNEKGSTFCESCGRRLDAAAPPARPISAPASPYRPTESFWGAIQAEWLFLLEWLLANVFAVLLWVLLIGLAVMGVYQLMMNRLGGQTGVNTYLNDLWTKLMLGQVSETAMYIWIYGGGLLVFILLAALYGALVGSFQWLVLRRRILKAPWIWRTMLGVFLGIAVGVFMAELTSRMDTLRSFALTGLGVGLAIGFVQWSILRSRVNNALAWVAANAMAMLLAVPVAYFTDKLQSWVGLILAALIISLVTGLVMAWLVRQAVAAPGQAPA